MKKYISLVCVLSIVLLILISFTGKTQEASEFGDCDTQADDVVGFPIDVQDLTLNGVSLDEEEQVLYLRLNQAGTNFISSDGYDVTTNWRMTASAADFNGDGLVDLAEGGRRTDYHRDSSLGNRNPNDTNLSVFSSEGKDLNDEYRFIFNGPHYIDYSGTPLDRTYEIIALGAGDYDGDGDADISALSWQGRLWIFWNLYVDNELLPGDTPEFNPSPTYIEDVINDGYGEFGTGSSHYRWESNIASYDIDGDLDLDMIVGIPSRWASDRFGQVVIYINNGSGIFSRLVHPRINPYPNRSSYIYGVCAVAAGDFDKDGDVDLIVGSANSRDMYFYENDGLGNFSEDNQRGIRIRSRRGSATLLREGDLDNDGDFDFILSTDGHNVNTPGGYVIWYENIDDTPSYFDRHGIPNEDTQMSSSGDLDSGALGDFDNDGDLDFFVADGNDSRNCYFVMNDVYLFYVDRGEASSRNLLDCDFITSDNAIVAATLRAEDYTPPGTSILYYMSNLNDENGLPIWEGPVTSGEEHMFASPGLFLRWKAEISTQDTLVTPRIYSIDIDYKYIEKREYSRTSHAFILADIIPEGAGEDQVDEEVLYSGSFEYPSWKGHLRSWNVTSLALEYTTESQIDDIKDVGASFVVDAGEELVAKSYNVRNVFTAYDSEADGEMNDKLDFNAAQADTLDDYLGVGEESSEVVPLIEFVLGRDRDWKLGDINHSTPQALGPPNGEPSLMGDGYEAWMEEPQQKDRRKVIIVGSNDGMLHCFDAVTLEELWAFIPHNLLYKLKKMKIVDPDCGEYISHQFFVDGTPSISDVYFDDEWHTVLICGQGMGWGKDHKWYYFALDITDLDNPLPLWELTDDTMGETWSVPAIGKLYNDRWVAFFGSGYDSEDPMTDVGNYFYVVDVESGEIIDSIGISDTAENPYNIQNTLPSSPAIADVDRDGRVDSVYFGDLRGRMWKVDATNSNFPAEVIHEDPYLHPIITKPAVSVNQSDSTVNLYFGTGGDDNAPTEGADASYSFIALNDDGSPTPEDIEWYIGPEDLADQLGISLNPITEFDPGEKNWADPVISDTLLYIASSIGSIESLNPCLTLGGSGRIYSRYTEGTSAGASALIGSGGEPIEFLATLQKVRSAVTVGETQEITEQGEQPLQKRKIFIQDYTRSGTDLEPPSEVLSQVVPQQIRLIIKSWREIFKNQ